MYNDKNNHIRTSGNQKSFQRVHDPSEVMLGPNTMAEYSTTQMHSRYRRQQYGHRFSHMGIQKTARFASHGGAHCSTNQLTPQNRRRPSETAIEVITLSSDDEIEVIASFPPKKIRFDVGQGLEKPSESPRNGMETVVDDDDDIEILEVLSVSTISETMKHVEVSQDAGSAEMSIGAASECSAEGALQTELFSLGVTDTSLHTNHKEYSLSVTKQVPSECPSTSTSQDAGIPPNIVPAEPQSKRDIVPVRKSKRISRKDKDEQSKAEENELISNFHNGIGVIDRGTTIPKGLHRVPFRFKNETSDRKTARVKDQLKIDMQPVFTPAGKKASVSDSSISDGNHKFLSCERREIRVGAEFQVHIPGEVLTLEEYKKNEDKEEQYWRPVEFNEKPTMGSEDFYRILRNVYWRAIWRQFESHIPFETALKHLMENDMDFAKSLDTIDQTLKELTQTFKPPCAAQVKLFSKLLKNKGTTRRHLQEKAMKNYHIGEVQQFHYRFRRFYKYQKKFGVACNCEEELCKDIAYEPRYGCEICKNSVSTSLAEIPHSQDALKSSKFQESQKEKKLCLICITYHKLTGTTRLATDVVFNEDELLKIQKWNQEEKKLQQPLSRQQFEDLMEQENNERWKNNDLSSEEYSMLNHRELKPSNRKHKAHLTEEEEKTRGEHIAAQLQPFVLPHFTKCNCKKVRTIPSRNEINLHSSFNEQKQCVSQFDVQNGNIQQVARNLNIHPELVRRLMSVLGDAEKYNSEMVQCLPSALSTIETVPPSNMPPAIPDQ